MQITISGHHVDVTDPLREYVQTKFDRLQRHYSQITQVEVTLLSASVVSMRPRTPSSSSTTRTWVRFAPNAMAKTRTRKPWG